MDDEIEIDDLIDDEEEEESTDEETSPDVDGETVPDEEFDGEADADNEPTIVIDDSTSGGQGGDVHPIVPDDPAPVFETTTRTIYFDEPITDYSSASLAAYEADGAVPVAILDDGTERTVTWSDVFDPRPQPVSATYVNEAAAVAAATNQHFWSRATDPDQDGAGTGAFVTDDEQDDFLEAAAQGFPDWGDGTQGTKPWHNLLMNSLGILLRTALYNLVSITRSAIAFFDGTGNQAANVVASFGSGGAQIGKAGESHAIIDFNSMRMVDKAGAEYLNVGDMRGADNKATITEAFEGTGTTYHLEYIASEILSCKVNGSPASYTTGTTSAAPRHTYVTLSTAMGDGDQLVVVYKTENGSAKSYTIGTRAANSTVGPMSHAHGAEVESSGYASHAEGEKTHASGKASHAEGSTTYAGGDYSHAEGWMTHADGAYSHAEGNHTTASKYSAHAEGDQTVAGGGYSHAEGWNSKAQGMYSHAQNMGTIAKGEAQTAIGRYNVEDDDDLYALIIGNGEWDEDEWEYTRSNALTVDWNGNVECNEVNGLALQSIGEMREASGTASVETATNRNVATIRLPPGTWLVNARLQYPSNSTGRRAAKLSTTSEDVGNVISTDVRNAVSGGTTQVQTERAFAISGADVGQDGKAPVYLIAWQNSGSTLSCAGSIQAVRLSPAIGESYDGGGGGGGGTSDYADLTNKPAINGVTLSGDKSSAQLGLQYTGDEALPNEVSGAPNPSKNIIVDNDEMTIQANLLTAAQAAALFT